MIPKECKRLAEVDFPIAEVSKHSAREKPIRHGHPSTLHLWRAERELGFVPRDVSTDKCGYDVESRDPNGNARLRFVEVKGRTLGADTVTITKNEILTALNKPEQFILAVVEVDGEEAAKITYMRKPFGREPDFGVTSVNYKLTDLFAKGEQPR